jgi:deazaflavin-dependent oxidoreductase (nitroreductase family)
LTIVDPALASEQYCYLTTRGRRTGNPRTIEIWFGLEGDTLYMLSGERDRSNWVRNLQRERIVGVRISTAMYAGLARLVEPGTEEEALARRLLLAKYAPGEGDLSDWAKTALPVAVDLMSKEN